MRIVCGGSSDVGRVRSNNEDSYRIVAPLNLFVLSDGMGGEAHGEVASALAVESVAGHCLEAQIDQTAPLFGEPAVGWSERTKRLVSAVHLANRNIYTSAEAHAEQQGMGATLSAVWVEGERMSVAHVGDSRVYLLRAGGLHQLTSDHSLVAEQVRRGMLTPAEAERSEMQSVLLRALGTQPDVEVDTDEHALIPRDVLLICSDGLTRMVTEPEIAGTLQAETDPQLAAEKLVALANENGGADNVTVIVVRVDAEAKGLFSWLRGSARKTGSNGDAGGGA
ncbi:MAG: Stp1/IreP family PP2C-type Ser/Thr phosphatase [Acidobacteriia bacterium]|nr:Stp1/IreP family PP2C-type Ser/Thr phosphatase [Terriglobia bacterium]